MPEIDALRAQIPKVHRNTYDRRARSRAAAIKTMCLACVGWEREEVRKCSDQSCPLWIWRPYKPSGASGGE